MREMFKNSSILITGGTGSFGNNFLEFLLKKYKRIKKIIIFSRDELKQSEMAEKYSSKKFPNIRFFLGDVRDLERLKIAMNEVDYVVHAAALKQVPSAEYNPFEVIKTNILGAQNIIEASFSSSQVKKVISLSTDKAAAPINLYGASKLCSDKLMIAANNMVGKRDLTFSVVRYGNVMGSRGSVIPKFNLQKKTNVLTITDKEMTRFNITLNESIQMVDWAISKAVGGEIIIPKIPSFKVIDLAKVIAPKAKINLIGIRQGEKIHEDLITNSESLNTLEKDDSSIIRTAEKLFKPGEKKYNKLFRNQENVKFVLDAMFASTNEWGGTSYRSRIEDKKYQFAGKTGTAQVKKITERDRELDLDTAQIPYEERDHAWYIAFGPYKNPRYAVSILVEHGGSGSSAAAPLAKKLFKKIVDRHEEREKIRNSYSNEI